MLTDAQLAILTDVATLTRRHNLDDVSWIGYRRKPRQTLIDDGYLRLTDAVDPDTDGGRYRVTPTPKGWEALYDAVAKRLVHLPGLSRVEAEGALF